MKIKSQLNLIIVSTLVVLACSITVSFWVKKRADRINLQDNVIRELTSDFSQSNQIRNEYSIYKSERAKKQWFAISKRIDQQIKSVELLFGEHDNKDSLDQIINLQNNIASFFNQLVAYDKNQLNQGESNEIRELFLSQMIVHSHLLNLESSKLSRLLNQKSDKQMLNYSIFTTMTFVLLGLVIIMFSILIKRRVTRPLTQLTEGTKIIAGRKFDYKLDVVTSDEIGELASGFNLMTEQLAKISVSRDELVKEIEKRILIEDALKNARRLHAETEQIGKVGGWEFDTETLEQTWTEEVFRIHEVDFTYKPTVTEGINFYTPKSRPIIEQAVQRAIEYGEPFDVELEIVTAKGNIRAVHAIGKVDKEHHKILGFFQDITDHKQTEVEKAKLEAQLLQAQKMESVGRLAGGVAHDFNNMLTVILGHAQLGLMHLDRNHPLFNGLTEISKTAERSADLTRQLLAFARKQTIAPKVLNLNDTVSGMLKMLQRLIGEDINLNWHPAPNLWPVKMDPSQIDQILANLCVNARDSIANIGKITIETVNIIVDDAYCAHHPGFSVGEYVRLTVSDDGCGMAEETLTHIFEPFFTTKGLGEGTGLGLATVYGIVKQNNGFLNVYSEPGLGTTFTVCLPRHAGEVDLTKAETVVGYAIRGMETILLVEDDPAILDVTSIILRGLGYSVLAANSTSEAIRLASEHFNKIHLLITDVIMPDMNGRDLANKLQHLNSQLKCLYMSGYTADVIANHGVLDDGVHFIQKPFSLHDLATKVREVLDRV